MAIQYREAGAILDRLASGNGSLRALLYSKNNKAPIPILYAILTETLKCKPKIWIGSTKNYFVVLNLMSKNIP